MLIDSIVVLSRDDDIHAFALKRKAEEIGGIPVVIIDTSSYPQSQILVEWHNDAPIISFLGEPAATISSSTAVWWRRPQEFIPAFEITDTRLRRFVLNECAHTLDGVLEASGCWMVNNIFHQRRSNNKLLQLQIAKQTGFLVPETIVTNSPEHAKRFCGKVGDAIFKGQTDAKYHLGETRPVTDEILGKQDQLQFAPVMFQWRVPAECDYRVTVIGEDAYASRIESGGEADLLDWRIDQSVPIKPIDLEEDLILKCISLTRRLNLSFGALDLRRTPEGDVYFFEINPAGQFLFCEPSHDLPMTRSLYRLLARGRV